MVRALRPHLAVAGPSTANPTSRSGGSTPPIAADAIGSSGPPLGAVAIPTTRPKPVVTSLARLPGPGKQPPPRPSRPLRLITSTPASRASRSRANHCAPGQ
jgi:hypothetical protein